MESVEELIRAGKQTLEIEAQPGLSIAELRQALAEILEHEYALDIKIKGLPMCVLPYAFHLFENKGTRKNAECFNCRLNCYCNGFSEGMEAYVSRFRDVPDEISIEVTGNCNLKCEHCFNCYSYPVKDRGKQAEPSFGQLSRLIGEAKQFGVKSVKLSGGEPLLRRDIFRIIKAAKGLGLRVCLNTNGTLIGKREAAFISKHVDNVLIPFSAEDEKETGLKGSLELKKHAVSMLKGGPIVRGGVVLSERNVQGLEGLYMLAEELGLAWLDFFRRITSEADEALKPGLAKIARLNKRFSKNFKVSNAVPLCMSKHAKKVCFGGVLDEGYDRISIDLQGNAKPAYYSEQSFGNAFSMPLDAIWESMRGVREHGELPEECKPCVLKERCRGGSRTIARLWFGKQNARDPLMKVRVT
jgi:MoaA/NifB/PqqE/SkfB family radical SAM enzyme